MSDKAIEYLETAETAILNWMNRSSAVPEEAGDDEFPDAIPMLMAVMSTVGRAIGVLEGGRAAAELSADGERSTHPLQAPLGSAPLCPECGHITVVKKYKCINCGLEEEEFG